MNQTVVNADYYEHDAGDPSRPTIEYRQLVEYLASPVSAKPHKDSKYHNGETGSDAVKQRQQNRRLLGNG